jgi:hypothetical protein
MCPSTVSQEDFFLPGEQEPFLLEEAAWALLEEGQGAA